MEKSSVTSAIPVTGPAPFSGSLFPLPILPGAHASKGYRFSRAASLSFVISPAICPFCLRGSLAQNMLRKEVRYSRTEMTSMIPTITAWLTVVGATILTSLVMWAVGRMGGRRVEVIRKHFFCPTKAREVEVEFLARLWEPENLLGVASCSAFTKGEKIDCGRACVHWPQVRKARPLFPPPFVASPFSLFP